MPAAVAAAEHAPGRLERIGAYSVREAGGLNVAVCMSPHRPDAENAANADRITAAWNACVGLPTAALAAGVVADLVALAKALPDSEAEFHLDADAARLLARVRQKAGA